MNDLTQLAVALYKFFFSVALCLTLLYAQLLVPQLFFWTLWVLARRTPFGYLMTWRRCTATYYTNNTTEEAGYEISDLKGTKAHFISVGLTPPKNFDNIRGVDEEILFVSVANRFVGWSNLAPDRIRVFGTLHDQVILYGVWFDWHPDTRFCGTLLLELEKERSEGGRGVWVGAAKGGSANNPSGIRTFPWIWSSFAKVAPFSKFQARVPRTGEGIHH